MSENALWLPKNMQKGTYAFSLQYKALREQFLETTKRFTGVIWKSLGHLILKAVHQMRFHILNTNTVIITHHPKIITPNPGLW